MLYSNKRHKDIKFINNTKIFYKDFTHFVNYWHYNISYLSILLSTYIKQNLYGLWIPLADTSGVY